MLVFILLAVGKQPAVSHPVISPPEQAQVMDINAVLVLFKNILSILILSPN